MECATFDFTMIASILISLFILSICILLISKHPFFQLSEVPKKWVLITFIFKLLAATAFWWIYTHYYTDRSTADLYKYFDDAQALMIHSEDKPALRLQLFLPEKERSADYQKLLIHSLHWDQGENNLFNDNRSIIRIHFLILLISQGFFHLHNLIFCFLSFIGLFALFRFFKSYSSVPPPILFISLFYLPSILLFCSPAIKESWLFFCMGFFLFHLMNFLNQRKIKPLLLLALFLFFLLGIKPYVLITLAMAIISFSISSLFPKKSLLVFLVVHTVFIVFLLFNLDFFSHILIEKQNQFIELAKESGASSYFQIHRFQNFSEIIIAFPQALYNVWVRPITFIFENPLAAIAAIESLLLLFLPFLAVAYFKKPKKKELPLIFSAVSFILILSSLIGLSIPIMGAIVRYKVPIYPFYLLLIFSFIDFKRIPFIAKFKFIPL